MYLMPSTVSVTQQTARESRLLLLGGPPTFGQTNQSLYGSATLLERATPFRDGQLVPAGHAPSASSVWESNCTRAHPKPG